MKSLASKKMKNIDSACEIVKFSVQTPDKYKLKNINVISGRILEIEYGTVIVRKVKYSSNYLKDVLCNDVDVNAYNFSNHFSQYKDQEGTEYWNGSAQNPMAFLAIWVSDYGKKGKYAYSVYAPKGVKIKVMAKWESNFK